jgi:hypothetical protein
MKVSLIGLYNLNLGGSSFQPAETAIEEMTGIKSRYGILELI